MFLWKPSFSEGKILFELRMNKGYFVSMVIRFLSVSLIYFDLTLHLLMFYNYISQLERCKNFCVSCVPDGGISSRMVRDFYLGGFYDKERAA